MGAIITQSMNLFFSLNDKYSYPLAVLMTSILENNKGGNISFYVMYSELSEESKAKITKLKSKYKNCTINFKKVDAEMFRDLKTPVKHISKEAYFVFSIADLFPDIDKGLYIDIDTIVAKPLKELWNTDISKYYAAVVESNWLEILEKENNNYRQILGFDTDDLYFNGGVLLFNMSALRRDNISAKLFKTRQELGDKAKSVNQCTLNVVLRKHVLFVDKKWNITSGRNSKLSFLEWRRLACIIHYNGERKPWEMKHRPLDFLFKYKRYLWKKYANIYERISC